MMVSWPFRHAHRHSGTIQMGLHILVHHCQSMLRNAQHTLAQPNGISICQFTLVLGFHFYFAPLNPAQGTQCCPKCMKIGHFNANELVPKLEAWLLQCATKRIFQQGQCVCLAVC